MHTLEMERTRLLQRGFFRQTHPAIQIVKQSWQFVHFFLFPAHLLFRVLCACGRIISIEVRLLHSNGLLFTYIWQFAKLHPKTRLLL